MQVRGFSVSTHGSYLAAVTDLAHYVHCFPDKIEIEDIRGYFEYLATEQSLSGARCRLFSQMASAFVSQVPCAAQTYEPGVCSPLPPFLAIHGA